MRVLVRHARPLSRVSGHIAECAVTDVGEKNSGLKEGEVNFVERGINPIESSGGLAIRVVTRVVVAGDLREAEVLLEVLPCLVEAISERVGVTGRGSVLVDVFDKVEITAQEEVTRRLDRLEQVPELSFFDFEVVGASVEVGIEDSEGRVASFNKGGEFKVTPTA